jgi:epoxyqueuosine reductase
LRSVISLAYPYRASHPPRIDWQRELRGRIASYAFGADYHDVVLNKAEKVAAALATLRPGSISRTYVDTGPVFEREWAVESGLGWFGKNTNMLNREHGSYFFLAEIFTDIDLDPTNERQRDHCGTCRRCLDLCPTGALSDGYLMEPRLCISYLTIELKSAIPSHLRPKIGNWIFGCDICQEVCPWNVDGDEDADSELAPRLLELMQLDREGFRRRFGKTAVARTKRRGLLRNVAVALGNTGNHEAVPVLAHAMATEEEPLVRSHIAWALGQLRGASSCEALVRRRMCETDYSVQKEIADALEFF